MRRFALALAFLTLTAPFFLPGCASLGLQTETTKVDGERYLMFRPWMHYSVQGSGQPLVLIHDMLSDSHTWRSNVKELSQYFQVFTLDLPGFGRSVNPYEAYSLDFYTASLGLFLREMDFGSAVVAGHGMGAAIALDAYVRYPELVKSAVLINSVGFDQPTEVLQRDQERMGIALFNNQQNQEPDLDRIRREVLEASFGHLYANKKLVDKELVDHYMRWLETPAGRRNLLGALRNFSTEGLMQRLIGAEADLMSTRKMDRRGERTVLVIWGTEDPWYPPRTAEYFRARIPGAQVAILTGAGHYPQEEEPEIVTGLMLDALMSRPVPGNPHTVAKYDATQLLEEGRKFKRRKKFAEAKEKFKEAIKFNPYLGVAYYEIGDILFEERKYAEAIEMLNESLRIYPHNAQVHYRLGTTYHNQATTMARKWAEQGMDAEFIEDNTASMIAAAIQHYEDAGRLDPKSLNPWFNLGRLYEQAGDFQEVARVYGRLADADPKDLRAANLHINALLRADDREGAVQAIARVEKIKTERRKATWPAWRAKLLMELGHWPEAVTAWQRATDLDPGNAGYYGYLAIALVNTGKVAEAAEPLGIALRGDRGNPEWNLVAGSLAERAERWDEALERYRAFVTDKADDWRGAAGLARALLRKDEVDAAAKALAPFANKPIEEPDLWVTQARVEIRLADLLRKEPRKAKESAERRTAGLELLKRAYAKGYDCFTLGTDPDFASVKKSREFRAFRKKLK